MSKKKNENSIATILWIAGSLFAAYLWAAHGDEMKDGFCSPEGAGTEAEMLGCD